MPTRINPWISLIVLCLATLMIVLDTTIVNVALPSIKASLGFSDTALAWVVNAYILTFGGFLTLGGRLGDLYGPRKLFLLGLISFTVASLLCGLATTQWFLILMRAIQGIGGAVMDAVALSLMVSLFREPEERAKAMGYFGFVAAGGGSIGVLLGGVLTGIFNWHWIFLVNVPIGIIVYLLSLKYISAEFEASTTRHLDVTGAITVTAALMLLVYAIVNGSAAGWLSIQTLGVFAAAIVLFVIFVINEMRVPVPLIPLELFKLPNLRTANIVGVLWAGAMFAWFFLSALYLQLVLGYDALHVGLAFLPANLIMAVFSFSLSAKLVNKYGLKRPLVVGLAFAALGLFLIGFAPVAASYWLRVFPSMILLGIGAGIAFNPVLLAAMNDVEPHESGIASGIVNTAFMMGGALGLAILASLAASKTSALAAIGTGTLDALLGGYHISFFAGALFALIASLVSAFHLKDTRVSQMPAH